MTYWIILFLGAYMTFKLSPMRPYKIFVNWFKPSLKAWKEQLSIEQVLK